MDQSTITENRKPMERVLYEVKKVIVGQDHLLERLVVALLARGHILVEGVPGLAKTMAIKTLAEVDWRRVQAHPIHAGPGSGRSDRHADLQPEDWVSSTPRSARFLPTCCWRMKSTARRQKCRARCWK